MTISAKRILVTGARSPAALELARLLAAAGHLVYAADSVPVQLCGASRSVCASFRLPAPNDDGSAAYTRALREVVQRHGIELLVPTCEEIFHIAAAASSFPASCTVFTEPLERLEPLHNKWRFIRLAETLGFDVPATRLLTGPEMWAELAGSGFAGEAIVLKPVYSRFGHHVRIVRPPQADDPHLLDKLGIRPSPAEPWVAQRYVAGRSICMYGVAWRGELRAHAAYSSPFTTRTGACIHFEPLDHAGALAWVQAFVRAYGFTGQIAFDFIETTDGRLLPIECNPRATSGIHLFREGDGLDLAYTMQQPDAAAEASSAPLVPGSGRGAMLAAVMLTMGLATALRKPPLLAAWWRAVHTSRDAVWRSGDSRPFLRQFRLLLQTLQTSRSRGVSMQQALTADIEWNGDETWLQRL